MRQGSKHGSGGLWWAWAAEAGAYTGAYTPTYHLYFVINGRPPYTSSTTTGNARRHGPAPPRLTHVWLLDSSSQSMEMASSNGMRGSVLGTCVEGM